MAKTDTLSRSWGDLVYDAFYTGAIGGSVVALFFLIVDSLQGHPLYTPSLMGSVLFEGAAADAVHEVRLEMVALYSVVHLLAFGAVGAGVSLLVHEVELHASRPGELLAGLVFALELGFFIAASLLMPGVLSKLGVFRVAMCNLLAAGGMGLFLLREHRPDIWRRLRNLGSDA